METVPVIDRPEGHDRLAHGADLPFSACDKVTGEGPRFFQSSIMNPSRA